MAINQYQNAAQNVYATSGTGGAGVYQPLTYDVGVAQPLRHRMFTGKPHENNSYRVDDITTELLIRMEVYTNMMLAGEIKTVTEDFIYAAQMVIYILKRAKTKPSEKFIEDLWARVTGMDGNVVENYTNELLYQLGIKR